MSPEPDPKSVLDLHHELAEIEKRIRLLATEMQQLNQTMPQGAQVSFPPHLEVTAAVNALTAMLIEAGVIDELAFRARKGAQVMQAFEAMIAQAKELKRQITSGLVIAQPGMPDIKQGLNGKHR